MAQICGIEMAVCVKCKETSVHERDICDDCQKGEGWETKGFIVNEVLTYIAFYLHRYPADSIKTIVAECCSSDDILRAKKAVVDIAEKRHRDCLRDIKDNRRDTSQRLATYANTNDIITILKALDSSKIDTPLFFASDLDKVPRTKPDDACNMVCLAERMNKLEVQMQQLQHSAIQQADVLLQKQAPVNTPSTHPHDDDPAGNAMNTTMDSTTVAKQLNDDNTHDSESVRSVPDDQESSANTPEDDDGDFMLTREERRRLQRRERLSWPLTGKHPDTPKPKEHVQKPTVQKPVTEDGGRKVDFPDPVNDKAQVIMVCDSIPRHVKPRLFFGPRYAKIARTGWASTSTKAMQKWKDSDDVEVVVLHVGIRDIKDEKPDDQIVDDTQKCMQLAASKYKHAQILYSEILYTTDELMNDSIKEVNGMLREFCDTNDRYVYVAHTSLQANDDIFVDDTHINDGQGTRMWVRDVTSSIYSGTHKPANRQNAAQRQPGDRGQRSNRHSSVADSTSDVQESWRSARGRVSVNSSGSREYHENSGTKDLLKLFITLLDRV